MIIKKIKIKNYRNLDGLEIDFSPSINYIVGDNNIGKSNLLKLFDKLFNNSFNEEDYTNIEKRITIDITLIISKEENVNYKFNTIDNEIRLIISQGLYESFPLLVDTKKNHYDYKILKRIIFKELSFKPSINPTIRKERINQLLSNDLDNLKILSFDNYRNELYITMAQVLVYQLIYKEISSTKSSVFLLNNERILPIMVALDEPELHLNPYLQRTLIAYYKKILNNQDSSFLSIIKEDFNIDKLSSTLFIVTHSTEALIDDYKSIIRLYKKENGNGVASGYAINLKPNVFKHLSMMFQDIKEAFFCKKAIIVEGITEYGAFTRFAEKLNTPLDSYGICLINAQGEGSISKIRSLLQAFKIETFAVYDADVKRGKEESSHEFFTKEVCFEMEIVSLLVEQGEFELLETIACQIPGYNSQIFDEMYVKKTFEKINYSNEKFKRIKFKDLNRNDILLYKAIYFTWFYRKKGLFLGRIIGSMLPDNLIPDCYKKVIDEATMKKTLK